MSDNNFLLTQEFIDFSSRVAEIFAQKKQLKEELKRTYDRFTHEIKELDALADKAHAEFEEWKNSQKQPAKNESE